jgi:Major intrinsic protein
MNPARTFRPDLVARVFSDYWVYVAGPFAGALLAVGFAFVLRGFGGGRAGSGAAQGTLHTGWTENRTVINKAELHVFAALADVMEHLRFPIRGIDSDNGSQFINNEMFRYCRDQQLKFTPVALG